MDYVFLKEGWVCFFVVYFFMGFDFFGEVDYGDVVVVLLSVKVY